MRRGPHKRPGARITFLDASGRTGQFGGFVHQSGFLREIEKPPHRIICVQSAPRACPYSSVSIRKVRRRISSQIRSRWFFGLSKKMVDFEREYRFPHWMRAGYVEELYRIKS